MLFSLSYGDQMLPIELYNKKYPFKNGRIEKVEDINDPK